jgi:NADH-ubiquinone oxidoreductase chain 6
VVITHLQEYTVNFLDLFSILSIFCAILVIINRNPIVSVLFLICLFVLISGYLMLLGMNFIGLSYLLVYIGAVSILFLFILMLINIRISEIQTETNNSLPLAIVISVSFYIALYDIIPYNSMHKNVLDSFTSQGGIISKVDYLEGIHEADSVSQYSAIETLKSIVSSYDNINYLISNQ